MFFPKSKDLKLAKAFYLGRNPPSTTLALPNYPANGIGRSKLRKMIILLYHSRSQLTTSCRENLQFFQTNTTAAYWMLFEVSFTEDINVNNGLKRQIERGVIQRNYLGEYSLGIVANRYITLTAQFNITECYGVVCPPINQCHSSGSCDPSTGHCIASPPYADGSTCDDGNPCTYNDTCFNGTCSGIPVTCVAMDQCHSAGVCDITSGNCTNPALTDGTSCDDSNYCSLVDTCQNGICTSNTFKTCNATDQCHEDGVCDPTSGNCSNPLSQDLKSCNDGDLCTQYDYCQSGICEGHQPVQCNADSCNIAGTCDSLTGQCSTPTPKNNGTSCDDNNACTQLDICVSGVCTGENPVICSALDQCHDVGVCDTTSGVCTQPYLQDGTPCNDNNLCTQTDVCTYGTCNGTNPVICSASDQCHEPGVCDSTTGVCSNPNSNEGKNCSDGYLCSQDDQCHSGICIGTDVICTALDQCHDAGTCDNSTGICSSPTKSDGTLCDDQNLCTQSDKCYSGSCNGTAITCSASDQCHEVGVCNPSTGSCTDPISVEGKPCDDGNLCILNETCHSGICQGTSVTCTAIDQCHEIGICNPLTGNCSQPNSLDGKTCNDSDLCTQTDTCKTGLCVGSDPVVCPSSDQCFLAGVCDPSSGSCYAAPSADGSICDDYDACTQKDICQNGTCTGINPVICSALDECHVAGQCNSTSGICSDPYQIDGYSCNDNNSCSYDDICFDGSCHGTSVTCAPPDQCHQIGVCDQETGACTYIPVTDGTPCNDSNMCTQVDTCQSGFCNGSDLVICHASDQCHEIGVCDPASGLCSNSLVPDGTYCDDQNACTLDDQCISGVCNSNSTVVCPFYSECNLTSMCLPSNGTCTYPCQPCPPSTCNNPPPCHQSNGACDSNGQCVYVPVANGTSCDDSNACTSGDYCSAGTCVGSTFTQCAAIDQCHDVGVCNPQTGNCSNPTMTNGTICDDYNRCSTFDTCVDGVCIGSDFVQCNASDQCHEIGTCDPFTGSCSDPISYNNKTCTDGDLCTYDDTCNQGLCIGQPVICNQTTDQCHIQGTCQADTGICSNPPAQNGTSCSDGNLCTSLDACYGGVCISGTPVICSASDQCHESGTCDPLSGNCSNPISVNTKSCDDYNSCTQTDTCDNGICVGSNPVICSAMGQCYEIGTCDNATGLCSQPYKIDGTPCDDGNLCTQIDTCNYGFCNGTDPINCTGSGQCYYLGNCDPSTGVCKTVYDSDGTACDDGNSSTILINVTLVTALEHTWFVNH